jgi:hypothetical protein
MSKTWPAARSEIEILAVLGHELGAAESRGHRRRGSRWGRRSVAVAVALTLCLGGGALAATRILSVGDTIPPGPPGGPPENRSSVPQTIVGQGTAPLAGPFQITTYGSAGIYDKGEALEPRGLPCVDLNLTDPPPVTPVAGSSFCGAEVREKFTVSWVPVLGDGGRKELILFGTLPEDAKDVLVTANGSEQIPVQHFEGPSDYPGDVWAAPLSDDHETLRAAWVRADGSPGDRARDVSDALASLRRMQMLR